MVIFCLFVDVVKVFFVFVGCLLFKNLFRFVIIYFKFENPSCFIVILFLFTIYIFNKYRKTHTQYFFVSNISLSSFLR